jgi:hypothetical protein
VQGSCQSARASQSSAAALRVHSRTRPGVGPCAWSAPAEELTGDREACDSCRVADPIESVIQEYARRYTAHDAEGVTDLCLWPFVAIRGGVAIHLADRDAVRDHFGAMMDAYRGQGAATWAPVEIESHSLGEHARFETVRWNARDPEGNAGAERGTYRESFSDPVRD